MLTLIDFNYLPAFLLIFARLVAFVATVPIFSYRNIPNPFKIGISFFISLIIVSTIEIPTLPIDLMYLLLLLKEVMVGLIIGLVATLILTIVQIAGGFIDFQMGFAIANVMDPQTGAQSPIIGQYFYTFALLFILAIDGHHLLINGAVASFNFVELDQLINLSNQNYITTVIVMFSQMFLIAFQMAIPIVGSLFLVDVALGIIARTVPQLNVFVVGIPLKITVSFIAISVYLIFYISIVKRLFGYTLEVMDSFMRILGGI